jgi:hypothetical protein
LSSVAASLSAGPPAGRGLFIDRLADERDVVPCWDFSEVGSSVMKEGITREINRNCRRRRNPVLSAVSNDPRGVDLICILIGSNHILIEAYLEFEGMVKVKVGRFPIDTTRVSNTSSIGARKGFGPSMSKKERPASKGRVHKGRTRT